MQHLLIVSIFQIALIFLVYFLLRKEIQKVQKFFQNHFENQSKVICEPRDEVKPDEQAEQLPDVNDERKGTPHLFGGVYAEYDVIVSVCKNKSLKKYFIHLEDVGRLKSKMITPEGRILDLVNDLFDDIEEKRLSIMIATNRLTNVQIQSFKLVNPETELVQTGGEIELETGMVQADEENLEPELIQVNRGINLRRSLGPVGNENLKDYLIPVLQLIYEGYEYKEAFHIVKDHLDVRYSTVSSQCTRALGLATDEFVMMAENRSIIQVLKDKYPDRQDYIETELSPGYWDG